ncbi:MAG TPA: VanZ family protein [Anaerolineales bacterium]|nr:VanZ family protein [Anaerolineales bacterium]
MILDFDLLTWFVGAAALFAVLAILRKRGYGFSYLFCLSVFWVYLLFVLKVAVFPIPLARGISEERVQEMLPLMLSSIHFRPFFFGPFATLESVLVTIVQNLVLTMPFGFGLSFVTRLKSRDFLWLSVVFGVGIEVIQFVLSLISVFLGIWHPDHTIDVNDAILNIAGVLLGYGLFRIFASWYTSLQHKFKEKGLLAYIQNVTNQA